MKVVVATYEHRHGTDMRVFATYELANAWRVEIADRYWLEQRTGDKPSDRAAMADEFWNAAGEAGSEFFNHDTHDVEGLPAAADSKLVEALQTAMDEGPVSDGEGGENNLIRAIPTELLQQTMDALRGAEKNFIAEWREKITTAVRSRSVTVKRRGQMKGDFDV
jgi:hypothetical protein